MIVRVIYEKGDQVRFLGHLDVARIVQMSVRCAGWPVKMSEGFSPKPKMDFGSPLPVGVAGYNEVFEAVLTEDRPLEWLARTLSASIPRGFRIREILPVLSERASLSDSIVASVYDLDLKGVDRSALSGAFDAFMADESVLLEITRPKDRRQVDLRPFVLEVEVLSSLGEPIEPAARSVTAVAEGTSRVLAVMTLRHDKGRTIRPQWVLSSLDRYGLVLDAREAIIDRRKILFEQHRRDAGPAQTLQEERSAKAGKGETESG